MFNSPVWQGDVLFTCRARSCFIHLSGNVMFYSSIWQGDCLIHLSCQVRSIHLSGKVMFYSPVWQGECAGEGAAAGLQAYGLAAAGLRYSLVQSGSTVEVKVVHYFTVGTMLKLLFR